MPKILIADDESGMRILIGQTLEPLEDKGVELLQAGNGKEALEVIKAEKPDLVLLDVVMPEMSGFDVCNTVKNVLGIKDIYIMMLTGMKRDIDKQRGKDVGADYYMTKPFALDDLLERVVNVLGIET